MADGDSLRIGKANTASKPGGETVLTRNKASANTVFVARNAQQGDGILGVAGTDGAGVSGISDTGRGVQGICDGFLDFSSLPPWRGYGVEGLSTDGVGVYGYSDNGFGVAGESASNSGVRGSTSVSNDWFMAGVTGETTGFRAVQGIDWTGESMRGLTDSGIAVRGIAYGSGSAGQFDGRVFVYGYLEVNGPLHVVDGDLQVTGGNIIGNKSFKIDHPLDPENKYLLHSCVESWQRMNVYDGIVRLENGVAEVQLPEWFEALNEDFRYQLTPVGEAAPDLHVAAEISDGRFTISGGEDGMKVCWQVTGIRRDKWAATNPIEVEQEKSEEERGKYLDPSLYNAPAEKRVVTGPATPPLSPGAMPPGGLKAVEEFRRHMDERHERIQESRRRRDDQKRPPDIT